MTPTISVAIVIFCLVTIGAFQIRECFKKHDTCSWISYWIMYTLAWIYALNWIVNIR